MRLNRSMGIYLMASNPFDQFDGQSNPFDSFDAPKEIDYSKPRAADQIPSKYVNGMQVSADPRVILDNYGRSAKPAPGQTYESAGLKYQEPSMGDYLDMAKQGGMDLLKGIGRAGRNAAQGIPSLLGMATDAPAHLYEGITGNQAPAITKPYQQYYQYLDNPILADKTPSDRISSDAQRALWGTLGSVGMTAPLSVPAATSAAGAAPTTTNLVAKVLSSDPSAQLKSALGASLAGSGTREAGGGKTSQFIASLLGGMAPSVIQSLNQSTINPTRLKTLQDSQEAGYVVPPSTTNPTVTNKFLESIGGKIATQQDASIANQDITNSLAKRSLGIPEDVQLTKETLNDLRKTAGPAYDAVKNSGMMQADQKYKDMLNSIADKYQGAAKSFPGLANDDIGNLVSSLDQPAFDAGHAIDATSILRDKASKAYAAGDKSLGNAYRTASNGLEDLIERNLPNGTSLLDDFRNARKTIAKSYSVEKALNTTTGNVNAQQLASQLNKGRPLDTDLATAGRFGLAFPKAAAPVNDSGSVRNTDVIMGAGTSALSHDPRWLLYPFLRMGARNFLLSKAGQNLAVPSAPIDLTPRALGTMDSIAQLLSQRPSEAQQNR